MEFFTGILEFIVNWRGLLMVLLIFLIKLFTDYEGTKTKIRALIWQAEEKARVKELEEGGKAKMEWVVANGYRYLPGWLQLIITEAMFAALVQKVFDTMKNWIKQKGLLHD